MNTATRVKLAKWGPLGLIAVIPLGFVAFQALTGGPPFCSSAENRLRSALVAEPVLAAHPAGIEPAAAGSASCDEDDRHVEAWQDYRLSIPDAEALAFYREAADAGGWRPVEDGGMLRFTKEVAGSTASLSIGRRSEGEPFRLSVSAVAEGQG